MEFRLLVQEKVRDNQQDNHCWSEHRQSINVPMQVLVIDRDRGRFAQ
jgi:hypothetical protein